VYPKGTTNFNEVLSSVVNQYISINSLSGCTTSSISSQWFVNIVFNNVEVYNELFFEGTGWNSVDCGTPLESSSPCDTQWLTNLTDGLDSLQTLGLDYYFNGDNTTVTIFNTNCANQNLGWNVKINVGLTFAISCL
jgi:hypothetical protein